MSVGIFSAAGLSAVLGLISLLKSREYYRATVFKKALIEELLGYPEQLNGQQSPLANLSIETTEGMRQGKAILQWREADLRKDRVRPGSVVFYSAMLLGLFVLIDALCGIDSVVNMIRAILE